MNIPGITKALELDDEDWQLAVKLRGLSEHQREQFSTALGPTKPQKKPGKKAGKSSGKTARASSLQQQMSTALKPILDGGVSKMRCSYEGCGEYADENVHHLSTHPNYHPFSPPAQPADGSSSASNAATGSTASSVTEKGAASNVHHAGG